MGQQCPSQWQAIDGHERDTTTVRAGDSGVSHEKELEIARLEVELGKRALAIQELELERKRRELEVVQQQQLPVPASEDKKREAAQVKAEAVQDGEYLTMSTVQQGMGVRVTDSRCRLQEGCKTAGLPCSDQRVVLLNEPGVVISIDRRDGTAEVEWESKKGYMPVDCLLRCDAARSAHESRSRGGSSPGVSAVDVMRLFAALATSADAIDSPERRYVASEGFHLYSDLRSIQIDASKKRATCVERRKATVFTEEVMSQTQPCEFLVKVGDADKGIAIGVTKKMPNGYSSHLLGESGFEGTIGAVLNNIGSMVMHDGQRVAMAPVLADGDVVGLRVQEGKIYMVKNGLPFMDFQATGPIRFGISVYEPGQTATIIDSDQRLATLTDGHLKAGRQVRLPSSNDERLKSMRVHWNSIMLPHCGQVGQVLEVSKRSAKVSVGGNSFHWDLEVFDPQQKRFCHCGCDLRIYKVESTSSICDVCKTRNPRGSQTYRCESHDYDVCEYCNGKPTLPGAGSKVIRGPTWKWGAQDGKPYAEGTVCAEADVDGWFKVQWDSGMTAKYRGPPFQDVVLARENGLKGSAPIEDNDETQSLGALLSSLAAALSGAIEDFRELDRATYREDEGWHFYTSLRSIAVDDDTRKVAVCKLTRDATVVTQEVINAEASYTFAVKVCCASGSDATPGPITVGIVDDKPKGFSTHVIGNAAFKGSIGAMCMTDGGAIVHEGKIVGDAPGVKDGDIVSVRIQGGSCEWSHNGVKFHSCSVRGQFRFGVSLLRKGQSVEVHSSQVAPLDLNLGSVLHVTWGTQLKVTTQDTMQQLGKGAFGETWKAKLGDEDVAVKLLKQDKLTPDMRADFAREVKTIAGLTQPGGEAQPYLLKVIAVVPEKYAIVTELLPHDLASYLKLKKKQFTFETRATLSRQIALGMAWLAERQCVHRDLKMQNILIDKRGVPRIADFGLARPVAADIEGQFAGSLLYMAPECFDGHFSQKSDVYSYAYIMWAIFTGAEVDIKGFLSGHKLLAGRMTEKIEGMLIEAIKKGDRPDVSNVPISVSTRITACWHQDPCKRPTFESASSDLRQLIM